MTLRKRIDRLEVCKDESCKAPEPIAAVLRLVVTPSASGPVVVAAILRPLHGGNVVHTDREPGETEADFMARASERAAAGFMPADGPMAAQQATKGG